MRSRRPEIPEFLPEIAHDFSRDEAIAILCRTVARWAEEFGADADAQACLLAEFILRNEPNLCQACGKRIEMMSRHAPKPRDGEEGGDP